MNITKIINHNNESYKIDIKIDKINEGRLVKKSPKKKTPIKTPIGKVKSVSSSEETDKPNIVR